MASLGKINLAKVAPNHPLAHTQIVFSAKRPSNSSAPSVQDAPTKKYPPYAQLSRGFR